MNTQEIVSTLYNYVCAKFPKCADLIIISVVDDTKFTISFGNIIKHNYTSDVDELDEPTFMLIIGENLWSKLWQFNACIGSAYENRQADRNLDTELSMDEYPLVLACFDIVFGIYAIQLYSCECKVITISRTENFHGTLGAIEAILAREQRQKLSQMRPLPIPISNEITKYFL
jgi:hypothetical protein